MHGSIFFTTTTWAFTRKGSKRSWIAKESTLIVKPCNIFLLLTYFCTHLIIASPNAIDHISTNSQKNVSSAFPYSTHYFADSGTTWRKINGNPERLMARSIKIEARPFAPLLYFCLSRPRNYKSSVINYFRDTLDFISVGLAERSILLAAMLLRRATPS